MRHPLGGIPAGADQGGRFPVVRAAPHPRRGSPRPPPSRLRLHPRACRAHRHRSGEPRFRGTQVPDAAAAPHRPRRAMRWNSRPACWTRTWPIPSASRSRSSRRRRVWTLPGTRWCASLDRPLYTSAGLDDEAIHYFGCSLELSAKEFHGLEGGETGKSEENEFIRLGLWAYDDAVREVDSVQVMLGFTLWFQHQRRDPQRYEGRQAD